MSAGREMRAMEIGLWRKSFASKKNDHKLRRESEGVDLRNNFDVLFREPT